MSLIPVLLGLGSNIERVAHLSAGLEALSGLLQDMRCSPVFESLPGVLEVIPVTHAYKLVSREVKQEDSVVRVGGVAVGGIKWFKAEASGNIDVQASIHGKATAAGIVSVGALALVGVASMVVQGWLSRVLLRQVHKAFGGELRAMFTGGAFMEPSTLQFFYDLGLHVANGYGLTEAGTVLTLNDLKPFRADTVGKPLPGVEVRGQVVGALNKLVARQARGRDSVGGAERRIHSTDVG